MNLLVKVRPKTPARNPITDLLVASTEVVKKPA